MTSTRWAALPWLLAGLAYATAEYVAAQAFQPSYSYAHNVISDLGVPVRDPLAWVMNAAFCVQGALFLVGALVIRKPSAFVALAAANTVGNVLIAFFHRGSVIHAVGAVLAVVCGNAAMLAASSIIGGWHRRMSAALGVFGLVSFGAFAITGSALWERGSVYTILAWELLTGAWLLSRRPTP
jgi:hypothetical membrane protein